MAQKKAQQPTYQEFEEEEEEEFEEENELLTVNYITKLIGSKLAEISKNDIYPA